MPTRLRAPAGHGAVLAEPPADRIGELVEQNRRGLNRDDIQIDGTPLAEFRTSARREILGKNHPLDTPLLIAGHQPELAHPGVWVKNFALCGTARRLGGISLNLTVDNDTLKSTALRVPAGIGDAASVHLEAVAFDQFAGEEPYEFRAIRDAELFNSFGDRVGALTDDWGFEPLLNRIWPTVVAHPAATIGERFTAIRQQCEREWGCENVELSVSQLSKTAAFRRFAEQIARDLPRFRAAYNGAAADYRKLHRLKSRSHPVPDLQEGEAPFWIMESGAVRRAWYPGREAASGGVRPRALTLTLFARVCLGDFFIHGIGGGKYDEVTDAIIRNYFGIDPPAYQVLSATLHLPLPNFATAPNDLKVLERRARELVWNPERHLPNHERAEVKRRLAAAEPLDRTARRGWYQHLRALTDELRPAVAEPLGDVERALEVSRSEANANAVLQRRDLPWVLFPEEMLKEFLQSFLK